MSSSGLARRSQSFDQLDDPLIYSEIPSFTSVSPLTSSYSAAPLSHNSTPPPPIGHNPAPPPPPPEVYYSVPPPPPPGPYNSAPPPPPPPVHKPVQPQNEVEVHPEGPPPPPPSTTSETVSPKYRYSGIDWHSDLKEKLRRRAESVGNVGSSSPKGSSSPRRPGTPLDDQMYVDVVSPSFVEAQHRSSSVSSPPLVAGTNQERFSMTPPATPPLKRSEPHVPPPRPPKPNKTSVSSNIGEEDDASDSPFAKALKAAKLKKVASNDRSAPRV